MKTQNNTNSRPIGGWICSCTPSNALPLSTRNCPNCNRPLSQTVLDKVYKQVIAELRQDALQLTSERWKARGRRSMYLQKAFRIIMALGTLVWVVLMLALHRDFFIQRLTSLGTPIVETGSHTIDGFGQLFETLMEKLPTVLRFPITILREFSHSVRELLRFIF